LNLFKGGRQLLLATSEDNQLDACMMEDEVFQLAVNVAEDDCLRNNAHHHGDTG